MVSFFGYYISFNDSKRFEDRWVYLKTKNLESNLKSIWLKDLPEVISLPIAHMEGKFYADKAILDTIESSGQVALRYVDSTGERAGFPFNPNGSVNDIAGITDKTGKVLGLMPHPERCIFTHHQPLWQKDKTIPWGIKFFENAVNYFK